MYTYFPKVVYRLEQKLPPASPGPDRSCLQDANTFKNPKMSVF